MNLKDKVTDLKTILMYHKDQKVIFEENVKEAILENNMYVRYLELRQYTYGRIIKSKEEQEIYSYFKTKYSIRLFETNSDDVINLIFGDFNK